VVLRRARSAKRPTLSVGLDSEAAPRLAHLMLVGGSELEWDAFDDAAWEARIDRLVDIARSVGAPWVTVRPAGAALAHGDAGTAADSVDRSTRTVRRGSGTDAVTVVIDPEPDARTRFARALSMLAADGVRASDVTEARLAALLCQAPDEPDLAVILGPSDRLPTSVSWELAYAEMVFLDVAWCDLDAHHLRSAVEQYGRRERRFGGVDP
jgi:hypothetical protein